MLKAPVSKALLLLLCTAIAAMPMGCATSPPEPYVKHHGKLDRAVYRVAVISVPTAPEIALRKPWGKLKGTFIGIGKGALEALDISNGNTGDAGVDFIVFTVIYTIAGPIFMIKGGIEGASQGLPGEEIEENAATIGQALERTNMQVLLRDEVVKQLSARVTTLIVTPMDTVPEGGYTSLRPFGHDTVLELSVLRTGLMGDDGVDPLLAFFMDARVRLINTGDDTVIFDDILSYTMGEMTFRQWAMDDAHEFRNELGRAIEDIASQAVIEAFGPVTETDRLDAATERAPAIP